MQKKVQNIAIISIGLISLCAQTVWADEPGKFSVATGFDYSSGKYGTNSNTDILSIPVIAKYEADRWSLKLTVPYVSITGDGSVLPGIGKAKNSTSTQRTTESGLGDIVAGATYNLYQNSADALVVDFTGKVKFGTADTNKGLGTGENDYSGEFNVYKDLGKITVLGTVGYKVYGDTSTTPLNNVFFGSVGGIYKLTSKTSTGIIYDFRPKISDNGSNLSEMTAFVNHKVSQTLNAQGYLVKGFANGSPDYGIGGLVSYAF